LTCAVTQVSVSPAWRICRLSPTQTIGVSPCRRAAAIFLFTPSSVSPKYSRRSECPMMTYWQNSLTISGEISPV